VDGAISDFLAVDIEMKLSPTKLLYPNFPRQISMPYRKTVDKDQFYSMINLYNGKKRIFSSIYNYTGNYEYDRIALQVDKIFFDFDGDEAQKNTILFVEKILEKNYKFSVFFSGGGFHVYVFTDCKKLYNPKYAIAKFQMQYKGIDKTIVGDVARVATIPNTYNTKRKRFCIPITIEELYGNIDHIHIKARQQRFYASLYGSMNVSLVGYDTTEVVDDRPFEEPVIVENIKDLPPCLNHILSLQKKGFRNRYILINYLKDYGYLESQIKGIIKEFFTDEEYTHCIKEEKQLHYLYWKNTMFPKCEGLKSEGICLTRDYCEFTREYDGKHLVKIYR